MKRVRLFTTAFPERNSGRRAEYAECLLRNIECEELDEVRLLVEGEVELPKSSKVVVRRIPQRPLYSDYFRWIEEVADADDISVIANADIYFDNRIGVLRAWAMPPRTALALSRWDITSDGDAVLNDRNDSQDSWVFRGRAHPVRGDFPIGVPRCDNRLVKELETSGYAVINPSLSLRSYHLHGGARGEYDVAPRQGFVDGPYGYVWPGNLLPLHRALWHNARNTGHRVRWHFDSRHWGGVLKLHWFRKAAEALTLARRK